MEDTIVAISTAVGVGAIAIIRMSGPNSIDIINQLHPEHDLNQVKSHTINYGHLIDGDHLIDEVLITIMKAPKTYTKENIVEINCHSGVATTNKILETLLKYGARLATPGEFTKRAFLNGRIDLIEAEAVNKLLQAQTDLARDVAISQLHQDVSKKVGSYRNELKNILTTIAVNIDYPEYEDIAVLTADKILPILNKLLVKMEKLLSQSKNITVVTGGINVGIVGRPNVGKSSLLNYLLNKEKAIVTNIPGTTRDSVEGTIKVDNLLLNLIDTAGIRDTNDVIERIGVTKSHQIIKDSDLILFVLNNNEEISLEELELLELIKSKPHIIIVNKIDLPNKLNTKGIDLNNVLNISLKDKIAVTTIIEKIKSIYNMDKVMTVNPTYLNSPRSIGLLEQALLKIKLAISNIKLEYPIDLIEIDVKEAWRILGEITGEFYNDELLDNIFENFCLGK